MQSIFLKIFWIMLIAALIVGFAFYRLSSVFNESRLERYVTGFAEGIFVMIAQEARHQSIHDQKAWLSQLETKSGLKIDLIARHQQAFNAKEIAQLKVGNSVVRVDTDKKFARVFHALDDQDEYVLSVDIHDINTELMRLATLLILQQLKHIADDQQAVLIQHFDEQFAFPVELLNTDITALKHLSLAQSPGSDLSVFFDEKTLADPALIVYASTQRDNEVLRLGPAPIFNWAPSWFIILLVGLSGSTMAVIFYLTLRPLHHRLRFISNELENLDLSSDKAPMTVIGNDMLSLFAIKVNNMSARIRNLVSSQRDLTQAVSHELRTPIARLKFQIALMEDTVLEDNKAQLVGIERDVNELEALVDEILVYGQMERGQLTLNTCYFNLYAELQKLLLDISPIRSEVDMQLIDDAGNHMVIADPHYLLRACQNLLVNAQRHAKTRVEVTISEKPDGFVVDVHDDGEGIPDEDKTHIFQPFTRVDSSRNRRSGGYGLGLAIVHQIMLWHEGEISVHDSPLGGCLFSLQWPVLKTT